MRLLVTVTNTEEKHQGKRLVLAHGFVGQRSVHGKASSAALSLR